MVDLRRARLLKDGIAGPGPVVYWMSRDQRARDNWALLFAQERALQRKVPLVVAFSLSPSFLGATIRQYGFMIEGLKEVEEELAAKNISFQVMAGNPEKTIPAMISKLKAGLLVTDFDPLRIKREWKEKVRERISVPFWEVDAHNVVPCWVASHKQEFSARTFRPKIDRLLPEFKVEFPVLKKHPFSWERRASIPWERLSKSLRVDKSVSEVKWIKPGEKAAKRALNSFLERKLSSYQEVRNRSELDGQSHLSPYLHFGQLSAQRVVLEAEKADVPQVDREAFLEELIVRRELSDNYCFYNLYYDHFEGFPDWAKKTLNQHRSDAREYLYELEELEMGRTHDELWNSAQLEMVIRGKMHGFMRMYWAKKILEWTPSPEDALEVAIYLNDRYELDGRDPNGYTGIAWSIGGVHDRAWGSRPIFGKIRYMSYRGCARKFNVPSYIEKVRAWL